jgi:hypothetical protein
MRRPNLVDLAIEAIRKDRRDVYSAHIAVHRETMEELRRELRKEGAKITMLPGDDTFCGYRVRPDSFVPKGVILMRSGGVPRSAPGPLPPAG